MPVNKKINRRTWIKSATIVGVAGWSGVVRSVDATSANEKLRIAFVGCDGQADFSYGGTASENIVAICDVDSTKLGKRGESLAQAAKYRDYRKMLDEQAEKIDAVVVATPDHIHAPATYRALRLGKHVYCEKPLTHTVGEARQIATLASEKKVATQMGTQIHAGENYRRAVELIEAGAIGKVSAAHCWVARGWCDGRYENPRPAPADLDWDLWLGPSPTRPYYEGIHPFNWRRFWDFGTGSLGDMGCHIIDLAFWALKLRHPTQVKAEGPPVHQVGCPSYTIAEWTFARAESPEGRLTLTWHDGDKRPALINELKVKEGLDMTGWSPGVIFVGTEGHLCANYGEHVLLPKGKFADYKRPSASIARSVGHHREWINACKTGSPTTCNFDYSGALTETVLLGTVAYRVGAPFKWDGAAFKADSANADALMTKEYRKGWELA